MGRMIKLAWYQLDRGKMDRKVQDKFERAQRLADETGQKVTLTLKLVISPPKDPKEPEYQPVAYSIAMPEPAYKSGDVTLVRQNNIAVADAEIQPNQEHLELEDRAHASTHKAAPAAEVRNPA